MDSKKSNKIREIVKLQQMVKQWKKLANSPKNTNNTNPNSTTKSIKFLKKTLSFSDRNSSNTQTDGTNIPKGYLAICVGEEEKRFVIPTMYLGHRAFGKLLREAEEEYGFQQEGVLKLPCEVCVFEKILKMVEKNKRDDYCTNNNYYGDHVKDFQIGPCFSPDEYDHLDYPCSQYHPQMCR